VEELEGVFWTELGAWAEPCEQDYELPMHRCLSSDIK
jgi:hypothetical protein